MWIAQGEEILFELGQLAGAFERGPAHEEGHGHLLVAARRVEVEQTGEEEQRALETRERADQQNTR